MVSLLGAVRDINRLREISLVLARHGFADVAGRLGLTRTRPRTSLPPPAGDTRPSGAPPASGEEAQRALVPDEELARGEAERQKISTAERVRLVAMDLGPSFVKLGQIASTRRDLLPEAWIVELAKLQDEVRPVPFAEIEAVVEASLGARLDEVFASFDRESLAAASIAQAHRAVLRHPDGPKDVVVKVQRPGVAETVARDLELLHALARLVERTMPESHIYQPAALVDQFDRAITAELDFTQEAEHAKRFAHNFAGHPSARFPFVYREASSKRVLTMERLDGYKIQVAVTQHGFEPRPIAKAAASIIIKMIFEDGFFHADPHPGNILLCGDPKAPEFGMVDLGMVGRLSPEMRDKTVDLMLAATRKDHEAMADALYAIGTPTKKIELRAFRAEVARLSEKYLHRPLQEVDLAALVADLVQGAGRFGLEIPSDFLLVGKALMTVEGIAKEIAPDLDFMAEARPYFVDMVKKRYAPERLAGDLWRGLQRVGSATVDLPQQLREVMDDLRDGRLSLQTRDPGQASALDRLGRRIGIGLTASACLLGGAWLLGRAPDERALALALLGFGCLLALLLLLGPRPRG